MSAPPETFDLAPFLDEDAYISDANDSRIREAGILIACALQRPSGTTFTAPLQCRRRPNRRPCRTWMEVRRSDVPPAIEWNCPGCGAAGRVIGWQGTWIEDTPIAEGPPLHTVRLPYTTYQLLFDLAQDDEGLQAVTFSAEPHGDAEVEVTLRRPIGPGAEAVLKSELLVVNGPTEARRIEGLLHALVPEDRPDLANDPAEVEAVFEDAMKEALADPLLQGMLPMGLDPDLPPFEVPRAPKKDKTTKATGGTHRIKVTLDRIRPPIWRRLEVPSDLPLSRLHHALQIAMGWQDCHLHMFVHDGVRFEPPNEDGWGEPGEDSAAYSIGEVLPKKGDRLRYVYDFGDRWEHTILVEEIRAEPCTEIRCLKGKRACPPEDVGGPWGYGHMLESLADPTSEAYEHFDEWIGADFDPEEFDLARVNAWLGAIRVGKAKR